jgi:predicted Zn finger-like uncharacterized protein
MSIITQCPQCATQFRATPQQLRASEGWVRCGQCDQVFDASAHAVSQRAVPAPEADAMVPLRAESPAVDDAPLEYEAACAPSTSPETLFSSTTHDLTVVQPHWTRRLWLGAAVLLALLLLGQWVGHEKNILAARVPALKPVLDTWCEAVGCVLKPPRAPEFLQIESSAYDPLGEDLYRLTLTLRNTASWPIAYPAIELTITDASEQALVRRVLLPGDLRTQGEQMDAHSAHELTIYLRSSLAIAPGLSGYRLTAFYP